MLGKKIDLQDFQPDANLTDPGIVVDMDGFLATARGLKVMPSLLQRGPALPGPSLGSYNATLVAGDQLTVAGTAEHLWMLKGNAWIESDGGQTFTPGLDPVWRFTVFGNDIIAVNGVAEPQISVDGADFAPLSTLPGYQGFGAGNSPPIASIAETTDYGVFLVLANSNSWVASILGDRNWQPDIANSVASASLTATQGPIVAAHRLRGGIAVYKRYSLYFGQFTGPPFFWSFQSLSEQVGTHCNECVVNAQDMHFFIGPDDFYVFDGSSLNRIPNNVKNWFFERVDPGALDEIKGHFDRQNSTVIWHYASLNAFRSDEEAAMESMRGAAGLTPTLNEWIAYNIRTQKWTKGTMAIEDVVLPDVSSTVDLTYQEFADRYQTYDGIDALAYGSEAFSEEGNSVPAVFGPDHILYTLNGEPNEAYLLTGEISDGDNFYLIDEIRPLFATYPITIPPKLPPKLTAYFSTINGFPRPDPEVFPATYTGPIAWLTKTGSWFFTQNGRSHQFRLDFNSACELTGFEISATPVGTQ